MADTLESLEIEVKHSSTDADKELKRVTAALDQLASMVDRVLPKLGSLSGALKRVGGMKALGGLGEMAGAISDETKEAIRNADKLDVLAAKYNEAQDKMEQALANGQANKAWQYRGEMLGTQARMNREIAKNEEDVEPSYSAWDRVKMSMQGVTQKLSTVAKLTRESGREASKARNLFTQMLDSFKRIALYRAFRKIISEIVQAAQEGLQNVYQFSSMIGSSISQTMDRLTSMTLVMKNQIGAAFGELLTTIQPILEAIISMITRVADIVAQFFAVLGGRSTYHKAIGATKQWVDNTQKGAAAAKEWKNQLMGFDEINRLEAPSDTDTGSGGAGNNIGNWDLSPITKEFPILEKLKKFISGLNFEPIVSAFERLKTAISELADVIVRGLSWAWDNILAPFITWLVEVAAPKILDVATSVIHFVTAVLEKIGPPIAAFWENTLKPIVAWIGEKFIAVLDWLKEGFDGLADKITNAKSFGEFLDSLNGKEAIILAIATAITAVLTALTIFNVVSGIVGAFGTVLGALTSPIGLVIAGIAALVFSGIALYQNWDSIKAAIVEHVIDPLKEKWEEFQQKFEQIVDAIKLKLDGWKQKWNEHVQHNIEKSDELRGKIQSFVADFKLKIQAIKDKLQEWKEKADHVIQTVKGFFDRLSTNLRGPISTIVGLIDSITSACQTVVSWLQSAWSWMNTVASTNATMNVETGNLYATDPSMLNYYAEGGWPSEGELFVSREAGPEMVGTIGGRTAVADNADIVAAIEGGVFNAMVSALGSVSSSGGTHTAIFNINGREFARATWDDQRAVAREHGMSLIANG